MNALNTLPTEHLSLWASAVQNRTTTGRGSSKKIDLYGIKKLRELILELATRGKLIPQNPDDEPASVLLERIAEDKAQLVKEKKIKKPKKLSEISEADKPFNLPAGWVWARLGDTGLGATGKTPSTKQPDFFCGMGIPFIGPGQITPSADILEPEKTLSPEGLSYSTEAIAGDILMV